MIKWCCVRVGVVWWYVGSIWWRRKRKGDDMVGGSQNANTSGSNDSLKTIVADIALELQAYQRLLKVNLLVDLQPLKFWQHQADLGNFNFLSKIGLRICGGILGSGQSERLHQIMKNGYGIKRHSLSFETNKLLTHVKVGLGNEQDVKDHGEYDIPPILSFYEQNEKSETTKSGKCRKIWLNWKNSHSCEIRGCEIGDCIEADHPLGEKVENCSDFTWWASNGGPEALLRELSICRPLCKFHHRIHSQDVRGVSRIIK